MTITMNIAIEEMDYNFNVSVNDYTDGTVRINFFHEGESHFDTMLIDKEGTSVTLDEIEAAIKRKMDEWFEQE